MPQSRLRLRRPRLRAPLPRRPERSRGQIGPGDSRPRRRRPRSLLQTRSTRRRRRTCPVPRRPDGIALSGARPLFLRSPTRRSPVAVSNSGICLRLVPFLRTGELCRRRATVQGIASRADPVRELRSRADRWRPTSASYSNLVAASILSCAMEWFENETLWRELYPYVFPVERVAAAQGQVTRILALAGVTAGRGAMRWSSRAVALR